MRGRHATWPLHRTARCQARLFTTPANKSLTTCPDLNELGLTNNMIAFVIFFALICISLCGPAPPRPAPPCVL